MATKTPKLILSSSRDIPFNKLVLSQANVRRVKAGQSIEELAEDIARRSLLQGLTVRPLLDADGAETGLYEVPAGGRRFRALELLVTQKRLARTAPVPCVVRDAATGILGEDDSLAENVQRAPLHPLDQFRAFQTMRDKGMGEDDIAAAFFVPVSVVRQRLRLTAVSPKLLDLYTSGSMTLEQLMAFTISDDHARQEQVWEAIAGSWSKEPYQIRRMLTERTVRASDKRALFVGIDAYEEAGGQLLRDLFDRDDGGWLQDVGLLERLVAEKLKGEADVVAAEGWKWIEAAVSFPYDHANGLRRLCGEALDLTAEQQAAVDALGIEYAALEAEFRDVDELPDTIDARLGEIEAERAVLEQRPRIYEPAEIARAGVFVSIDAEGGLQVDRGYVRPEDEDPVIGQGESGDATTREGDPGDPSRAVGVAALAGKAAVVEQEDDTLKPLPDRLVVALTAQRTLALRDAVASNPRVALTALLHKLAMDNVKNRPWLGGCLEVSIRSSVLCTQDIDLSDNAAVRALQRRQDDWHCEIPKDDQALWDWVDGLDEAHRLELLAHLVSLGVNALIERVDHNAGLCPQALDRRISQADRLAGAVGLDMVEAGWRPTVDSYLGRVTKPRILEAVREAKGEASVQLIAHLKKGDMAKEAERLLAGTGWLPEPLRQPDASIDAMTGNAPSDLDDAPLPAFLTDHDVNGPEAIAAE